MNIYSWRSILTGRNFFQHYLSDRLRVNEMVGKKKRKKERDHIKTMDIYSWRSILTGRNFFQHYLSDRLRVNEMVGIADFCSVGEESLFAFYMLQSFFYSLPE